MISIYFLVETSPPTCYNTRLCREYTLWPFCDINNSHGVPPRLGLPENRYRNTAIAQRPAIDRKLPIDRLYATRHLGDSNSRMRFAPQFRPPMIDVAG